LEEVKGIDVGARAKDVDQTMSVLIELAICILWLLRDAVFLMIYIVLLRDKISPSHKLISMDSITKSSMLSSIDF
jgi:hypothetical protein